MRAVIHRKLHFVSNTKERIQIFQRTFVPNTCTKDKFINKTTSLGFFSSNLHPLAIIDLRLLNYPKIIFNLIDGSQLLI